MPSNPLPILIADDQRDIRDALTLLLKVEGYATRCVGSPAAAIAAAAAEPFAAALIDMNYTRDTTSGEEGLDLLAALRRLDGDLPVIVMTAWGSIDLAVEAMRRGGADFIEKPWDNARLAAIVRNQVALSSARRQVRRLVAENDLLQPAPEDDFVTGSEGMARVVALIERIAPTDANVLIVGENGTGKSVAARCVHGRSLRKDRSLVTVNMGAIGEHVFESEMFGHVRGAFTDAKADRIGRFELADAGTLFLDEIATLPLGLQPKLLRVLESGEFERLGSSRTLRTNVRIVSATNADLPQEVAAGRFRKDLLYRLNAVEIRIPPLRERRADIAPLAERFLHRAARRYGREPVAFAPSVARALAAYAWPGNVRELEHAVERAVLVSHGPRIEVDDLLLAGDRTPGSNLGPEQGDDEAPDWALSSAAKAPSTKPKTFAAIERELLRSTLEQCNGSVMAAAEQLGLSRAALYRRLLKHGLRADD